MLVELELQITGNSLTWDWGSNSGSLHEQSKRLTSEAALPGYSTAFVKGTRFKVLVVFGNCVVVGQYGWWQSTHFAMLRVLVG